MKLLYLVIFVFLFACGYCLYYMNKFSNRFKLICLIGKKGAGKTTYLTKQALLHKKKGWKVYSNFHVPGCKGFDPAELGKLMFEPYSLILIDEIGLVFNNRAFKSFRADTLAFFKLQRHYGAKVIVCSQADDFDAALRRLVDNIYLLSNWFGVLSVARKVSRSVTIMHPEDGKGESRIVEDLQFTPWFTIPFGGAEFTWIPAWSKYFDSFDAPVLPSKNFWDYEDKKEVLSDESIHSRLLFVVSRCRSCFDRAKSIKVFSRFSFSKEGKAD